MGRRIVSRLFNIVIKIVFGFRGSDTHGIKVMKKEIVKDLLAKCRTTGGILDTELVLRAQYSGFKIADFPVSVQEIRDPRFPKGFRNAPSDIIKLYQALKLK